MTRFNVTQWIEFEPQNFFEPLITCVHQNIVLQMKADDGNLCVKMKMHEWLSVFVQTSKLRSESKRSAGEHAVSIGRRGLNFRNS
jgi:hypothetical protein